MKAITPNEAKQLHEPQPGEVEGIVKRLSDSLKEYDASRAVTIDAKLLGKGKVLTAVLRAFESSGWRVKFRSDPRDGDYYEFSE